MSRLRPTFFKNDWMSKADYSKWLKQIEGGKSTACCVKWKISFNFSIMNETDVKHHIKGPKHITIYKFVSRFFKTKVFELSSYV